MLLLNRITLILLMLPASATAQQDCNLPGDMNGDSLVTINDLMAVLAVYGVDYTTQSPGEDCTSVPWYGYEYDVIQIGDQCWFAENLRTQQYQNGDSIIYNPSNCSTGWASLNPDAGCGRAYLASAPSYWGGDYDIESIYGRLYNSSAVWDSRGLCPAGWSIPRRVDFEYLCDLYGNQVGTLIDDGLVVDGTGGWWGSSLTPLDEPPECGLDLSGLGLRAGGYGYYNGGSYGVGYDSMYWATSLSGGIEGIRGTSCSNCIVSAPLPDYSKYVRCIKD